MAELMVGHPACLRFDTMKPNPDEDVDEIVSPRQARRQFLASKKGVVKDSTVRAYRFPTKHFVEYCEKHDIETTGEITGYVIESWKQARRSEDIKIVTLHNNVKHLRVFIRWCESVDLVEQGLPDKITIPVLSDEQARSDDVLRLDHAEDILRYLKTYEYGSRNHALFHTLWHVGCRIGGVLALDKGDFVQTRDGDLLQFRNRKSTGTPLKNGNSGERDVTISDDLSETLVDYIEVKREDVTDDYGREPLFTTPHDRLPRQRAYKSMVPITRPCELTGDCPHDREIDECEAAQYNEKAPSCPSTVSLHPIRRGSISYHINRGWPKEKVSERVDVSVPVLDKHYDARTKEQERQGREEYIDLL